MTIFAFRSFYRIDASFSSPLGLLNGPEPLFAARLLLDFQSCQDSPGEHLAFFMPARSGKDRRPMLQVPQMEANTLWKQCYRTGSYKNAKCACCLSARALTNTTKTTEIRSAGTLRSLIHSQRGISKGVMLLCLLPAQRMGP